LVSKLQQALAIRTQESISNALADIHVSIEEGLNKEEIESDGEINSSVKKAKKIIQYMEKIEKRREKIISLKPTNLEKICDYSKPPTEVRNVLEASFILLGEDQEKLIVSSCNTITPQEDYRELFIL